jgi:hypothetical protein
MSRRKLSQDVTIFRSEAKFATPNVNPIKKKYWHMIETNQRSCTTISAFCQTNAEYYFVLSWSIYHMLTDWNDCSCMIAGIRS